MTAYRIFTSQGILRFRLISSDDMSIYQEDRVALLEQLRACNPTLAELSVHTCPEGFFLHLHNLEGMKLGEYKCFHDGLVPIVATKRGDWCGIC